MMIFVVLGPAAPLCTDICIC